VEVLGEPREVGLVFALRGVGVPGFALAVAGHHPRGVVVAQHPRGGRARPAVSVQVQVDHRPQGRRIPRAPQRVEREGGVHPSGGDVAHQLRSRLGVGLTHEDPLAQPPIGVRVRDPAPTTLDGLDLGLVPQRRPRIVERRAEPGVRVHRGVRHRDRFDQAVGHVDPEAVDAAIEPEGQDVVEELRHRRVGPVEVRLLGGEQVQVPLFGPVRTGQAFPGRTTEHRAPVGRRGIAERAASVPEVEHRPFRRTGCRRQRGPEQRVRRRAVVGDEVDQHPETQAVRGGDEGVGLLQGPEAGIDGAVVGHVVAPVGHRRGIPRAHPDRVHAEIDQIGQSRDHSGEVTLAVVVGVGEGARVDLVHHRAAPPGRVGAAQHVRPVNDGR